MENEKQYMRRYASQSLREIKLPATIPANR